MQKHINLREKELIGQLKKGCLKAFDAIYNMYAKRLYAYSIQFTKSSEEAEEIVQDVFVKLWKSREDIQQDETLNSLLFIIARHYLINAYRSKVNHPVYAEYIHYVNELSVNNTLDNLEYDEFLRKLNNEIKKLPLTQQKVINLSRFQQLSNKEVAEKLSLSEQTVKNQLSLGLKTLKENLGETMLGIVIIICHIFNG